MRVNYHLVDRIWQVGELVLGTISICFIALAACYGVYVWIGIHLH